MAKKPRRRRKFRRYIKGVIDETQALTGLVANTGLKQLFAQSVTEKAYVSSVKATYSMTNYTSATNVGPIKVYLAHGDYSQGEIEEWIEQTTTSWQEGDLVTREKLGRKIRAVGVFYPLPDNDVSDVMLLNNGRPITTKLGWMLTTGQTITVFWYNSGSVNVATSAPQVQIIGHANLWPA